MAPKKGFVVTKTEFPIYTVKALGDKHFLLGGGGGKAKTGIENAFEIYEFHGNSCERLLRYETGEHAIMNSTLFGSTRNFILATGLDNECQLYSLQYKQNSPQQNDKNEETSNDSTDVDSNTIRKRKSDGAEAERDKTKESETKGSSPKTEKWTFEVHALKTITAQMKTEEDFHKVLTFSIDKTLLFSGGSDGYIRIWKYPELECVREIHAHSHQVDDLDVAPSGDRFVSLSRDHGTCSVWNISDGKKLTDLVWKPKNRDDQYRFRACRFGIVEGDKKNCRLFTINIPATRSSKPIPCCITKWNCKDYRIERETETGSEVLSALAISDTGEFLALGTISGSVSVYIAFSLQRMLHIPESHRIFVTGLEFLPSSPVTKQVVGDHDASLISISADNQVKLYHIPKRTMVSMMFVFVCFLGALIGAYFLLDIVGL